MVGKVYSTEKRGLRVFVVFDDLIVKGLVELIAQEGPYILVRKRCVTVGLGVQLPSTYSIFKTDGNNRITELIVQHAPGRYWKRLKKEWTTYLTALNNGRLYAVLEGGVVASSVDRSHLLFTDYNEAKKTATDCQTVVVLG